MDRSDLKKKLVHAKLRSLNNALGGLVIVVCLLVAVVKVNLKLKHKSLSLEKIDSLGESG